MPYVITTRREGRQPGRDHDAAWSRRAVATLEEARVEAGRAVDRAEPFGGAPYGVWAGWRDDVALQLPESGGTVGPLPDGTTIEVEPVRTFGDLWETLPAGKQLTIDSLDRAGILAAFNAAQARP